MPKKTKPNSSVSTEIRQFKKSNEIISPRVARGGTLSLLGRKIFNVLLYHMQVQGQPGVGAPSDDPLYSSLYWLPLNVVAKDAAFNSEDTGLLKETLLKLQDIKIITDNNEGFSSDVLVASVKIIPGKAGRKTMLGWGMHATTEFILRNPEFYTRLSLYYLTRLRTTSGIALYENCKRYASNPSKLTRREKWEWWYDVLSGNPINQVKPEYKYFKRDILKSAIKEVNNTDIFVELIEHKNGRKVEALQFKIERQDVVSDKTTEETVLNISIVAQLEKLGISIKEAKVFIENNEESFLVKTIQLVEKRANDLSLPPLSSVPAFFKSALKKRYIDTVVDTQINNKKTEGVLIDIPIEVEINPIREAMRIKLEQMNEVEVKELLDSFIDENPHFVGYARKSPKGKMINTALIDYLVKKNTK